MAGWGASEGLGARSSRGGVRGQRGRRGGAHVGTAMALQQPRQQGQQQGEGQEVQHEAEEDRSDHAGFWRRLLADGRARRAAPAGSAAHDGSGSDQARLSAWRVCTRARCAKARPANRPRRPPTSGGGEPSAREAPPTHSLQERP